jgi:hypothetical protein
VSVETVKPPTVNILSSARPLSPEIEFIVPIYECANVRKTNSHIFSGRSGSALRIFMSGPWWSSGIGELLGVVILPGKQSPGYEVIPDDQRKHNVYSTYVPSRGLRVLFQDLIPL